MGSFNVSSKLHLIVCWKPLIHLALLNFQFFIFHLPPNSITCMVYLLDLHCIVICKSDIQNMHQLTEHRYWPIRVDTRLTGREMAIHTRQPYGHKHPYAILVCAGWISVLQVSFLHLRLALVSLCTYWFVRENITAGSQPSMRPFGR